MKTILVVNSGSSSVKFKLIKLPDETLAEGQMKGIGEERSSFSMVVFHAGATDGETVEKSLQCSSHHQAFNCVLDALDKVANLIADVQIDAIGHRIVHGGNKFIKPVVITDEIVDEIKQLTHLSPQHIASSVLGISVLRERLDKQPHVAVFDTAFHQTIPEHVYRYPIPKQWYEDFGIRKYGFHGNSHAHGLQRVSEILGKSKTELNIISLHLGNGASACAIQKGESVDTSMGFTPLEGLMMGNRSGDLDAEIPIYLQIRHQYSPEEVEHALNFESGLHAICDTNNMAEVAQQAKAGDQQAELALKMFVHHVRKYIGAYLIQLGHVDAIVFTGGIGEHADEVRSRCCEGLEQFGIRLDKAKNLSDSSGGSRIISSDNAETKICVIICNEELQIAEEVNRLLTKNA